MLLYFKQCFNTIWISLNYILLLIITQIEINMVFFLTFFNSQTQNGNLSHYLLNMPLVSLLDTLLELTKELGEKFYNS